MGKANLHPDFRELFESLNSAGVRYLVLGGYAVNHYGYRRATDDLDIWIAIDPDNTQKMSQVLQRFAGFPAGKVRPSMFRVKGRILMFGREPVRVDILTDPDGLDFEASYARRNVVDWDGVNVPLVSFEDLKANKKASARAKDMADLENLPATPVKRSGTRPRQSR